MGFKNAKVKVLDCLTTGHVLHEERGSIDIKNLFGTGLISVKEAAEIIGRATGNDYSSSPHHYDNDIEVHVIRTTYLRQRWYIKWYFFEPDCVFISFHH